LIIRELGSPTRTWLKSPGASSEKTELEATQNGAGAVSGAELEQDR
jgi:hypothetical protein